MSFQDLVTRIRNRYSGNQIVDLEPNKLEKAIKSLVRNKITNEPNIYGNIAGLSLDDEIEQKELTKIIEKLIGIIPDKKEMYMENNTDTLRYPASQFRILTNESSSTLVGIVKGRVFKIYNDEQTARREYTILSKLQSYAPMKGLCQVPATHNSLDSLVGILEPEEIKERQKRNQEMDFLSLNGYYIIITKKEKEAKKEDLYPEHNDSLFAHINYREGNRKKDLSSIITTESSFLEQIIRKIVFSISKNEANLDYDSAICALKSDIVLRRLMTLSLLHSGFKDEFSEDEVREMNLIRYHDFSYEEIKTKVEKTNQEYHKVFDEELQEAYSLASRRQKDIYDRRRSKDSKELDSLVFTHGDAKWDNWMNGDNVLIDFGSAKISTEYKDIAKAVLDSKEILEIDKIDDYIEAYAIMRKVADLPISESIEDLKQNVYDSILLEAMRTLYYKPENKKVAQHMLEVIRVYKQITVYDNKKVA
ncbi:MAG: hypothetical protein ACMXYG_03730 [Candidatus Woesearchaeota archaeon]